MTVYVCMVIDDYREQFREVFSTAQKARKFCTDWHIKTGQKAWYVKRTVA